MRKFVLAAAFVSISSFAAAQPPAAIMEAASHGKSMFEKEKERRPARPMADMMIGTLGDQTRLVSPGPPPAPPSQPHHAQALAAGAASEEDVEERLRLRNRSLHAGSPRAAAGVMCAEAVAQGSEALLRDAQLIGLCGAGSFRLGSSKLP